MTEVDYGVSRAGKFGGFAAGEEFHDELETQKENLSPFGKTSDGSDGGWGTPAKDSTPERGHDGDVRNFYFVLENLVELVPKGHDSSRP